MDLKDGLHPRTWEAFDHVDAAMFTGDPGETREKFEYMKRMIERWKRRIDEVGEDPWFLKAERMAKEDQE